MLFDVGNLITLGIVILVLIFFRLLDRSNRSLNQARNFADRWKKDINAYIDEKGAVIKDYGIALEVERKAASELMRRIQALTREELAQKVQALTQIDERIQIYDASLEELVQMTGRVQENLNRIRDESSFVENVGKRVTEIREKVENAEAEIDSIGGKLDSIEEFFGQKNLAALEKAVETAVSGARTAVSDFEASAQTIGRKIEEHREAVNRLEQDRENRLARDEERIDKLLTEAIDRAGSRADKVEEAALAKLREQAQDRLNTIKASYEEKIKSVQETVRTKLGEIQDQLKSGREEWKAETAAIEARQKVYSEDWKKDLQELTAYSKQQQEEWNRDIRQYTSLAKQQAEELDSAIRHQREDWEIILRDAGKDIFAATEQRLEEYRQAQEEQLSQISGISDDAARVEAELRLSMQEAINRVSGDFTRFGDELRTDWESTREEYDSQLETLREGLAGVDRELSGIKQKSFENVSQKLQGFEDDFLANLSKRSAEIDSQLASWQNDMGSKLAALARDSETRRQDTEDRVAAELNKAITAQSTKILSDLEQLKAEAVSFEGGIRGEVEAWQTQYSARMKELDEAMEDARSRSREIIGENDVRLLEARSAMDGISREIAAQTKLFERTDALKANLDRYVEDMNVNTEKLAQLKSELARFDGEFTQLKRLEDDVNAKMTRFLTEKRRIELMEADFNRLLQTSQSVEEKLTQVSNSDDVLQTMQVQLRHLEDVIKETEEKYQRMERKGKTLQEINDGIDRNFRALQEDEESTRRIEDIIVTLKTDLETIQNSVNALSSENEKARDAAEKLSTLDDSVKWLEKRIAEMNVARESFARLATDLQNLDKDAQTQLKLTRSLLDREEGKTAARTGKSGGGAPPPRDRENIIKLKRQGWGIEEIARTMGISRGEVELTLELGMKDT